MNLQTLYVGHQPTISQENIEAALQNMQENPCPPAAGTIGSNLIDLIGNTAAAHPDVITRNRFTYQQEELHSLMAMLHQ